MAALVPCIDKIRDLYTCLGTRAYTVAMVTTQWSGGQRGYGVENVIADDMILPTPEVDGIGELERLLTGGGTEEVGTITVKQISARFTEDQLSGRLTDGSRRPADQNFYWEIRAVSADGPTMRRRFQLANPPQLDMMNLQWTVTLVRATEDRTRQLGSPRS